MSATTDPRETLVSSCRRVMSRQRRIGLTGGIASGKSSVSRWLAQQNVPVLDADQYAHDVIAPGEPAWQAVIDRYGSAVLHPGSDPTQPALNRAALGSIVFADAQERRWLEGLIHPVVRDRFEHELLKLSNEPVVVLMIPLLFETGMASICSEVWVVNCSLEQQRQRLMARNALSAQAADQRIQAQWPLTRKCELADAVINNSGPPQRWRAQIRELLTPSTQQASASTDAMNGHQ